ncbi:MAG: 50S ribosomal protein L10 [Chitinophagales bacterium]|nr:50S ribosomal protein L10 [Chitinophagales bacterium]
MEKAGKKEAIDALTQRFSRATNFYIADASNLTVAEINRLRRICYREKVEFRVAKNTLIKKALQQVGNGYEELFNSLNGPTSLMFSDTANVPAKVIKEFRKGNQKPILKAAYIDSAIFIGDNTLDDLFNLKSKNELIGGILAMLQSPAKNIISALQSGGSNLSGILKTLSNKE